MNHHDDHLEPPDATHDEPPREEWSDGQLLLTAEQAARLPAHRTDQPLRADQRRATARRAHRPVLPPHPRRTAPLRRASRRGGGPWVTVVRSNHALPQQHAGTDADKANPAVAPRSDAAGSCLRRSSTSGQRRKADGDHQRRMSYARAEIGPGGYKRRRNPWDGDAGLAGCGNFRRGAGKPGTPPRTGRSTPPR